LSRRDLPTIFRKREREATLQAVTRITNGIIQLQTSVQADIDASS